MPNASKRVFKPGEIIYVVDYWGTSNGTQAFEAIAEILQVNEKTQTFSAILYGDTYQTYSFKDYGRLFFDTAIEASNAASALPKPQTIIYQKIGKRVYRKLVEGISGQYTNCIYDLVICVNRGKKVSTKEIGHTLFLSESDARKIH